VEGLQQELHTRERALQKLASSVQAEAAQRTGALEEEVRARAAPAWEVVGLRVAGLSRSARGWVFGR
jgi:hypothetical protein